VHITGNELTAISSAVAALAIVGGYLGVRSANRNALKIAREERSSKRKDELDALKRTTYTKTLAALHALATANIELAALAGTNIHATQKRAEAIQTAYDSIAELELVSPNNQLYVLAKEALDQAAMSTQRDSRGYTSWAAKLRASLRDDLRGTETYNREELDQTVVLAQAGQQVRAVTAELAEVATGSDTEALKRARQQLRAELAEAAETATGSDTEASEPSKSEASKDL
jgi:phage tail protein X